MQVISCLWKGCALWHHFSGQTFIYNIIFYWFTRATICNIIFNSGHTFIYVLQFFSPLIFLVYSLHAPTSCLLFLVYILISFYRLSFLSCAALLFMHSLMHSTITYAQSCTVCLLMCSLLRCSLITQYIRTG